MLVQRVGGYGARMEELYKRAPSRADLQGGVNRDGRLWSTKMGYGS
jgi:hypothetical protein